MNTPKRTRLNHPSVVGNCMAMVRQITSQMPGDLGDVDKTYLGHFMGLHALSHYSMYDRTPEVSGLASLILNPGEVFQFTTEFLRLIYSFVPGKNSTRLQPPKFYSLVQDMVEEVAQLQKIYHEAGSDLIADLIRVDQQIVPLIDGISLIDENWSMLGSVSRSKIYSYVLMHEGLRGFQHYERRIKLLIPANLEMILSSIQISLKTGETKMAKQYRNNFELVKAQSHSPVVVPPVKPGKPRRIFKNKK